MFRTALCLSGDPRYFENALNSIINNIIIPNKCDVFGHFWIRTRDTLSYKSLMSCNSINIDFMVEHCLKYLNIIKSKINFTV